MPLRLRHFVLSSILLAVVLILSSCTVTHVTKPPTDVQIYETSPSSFVRGGAYHFVAPGETLWRIARMYDVNIETLKEANKIRNVRDIDIGTKLYIPGAASRKDVITLYPSQKWKYIIVHHSATEVGSSQQFNASHLKRGWQGVGYHFVIDNGTSDKADGQIETTPRWTKQQSGAHTKAAGMNDKGIGICLVGNFSEDTVSRKQMESLVYLTSKLSEYYNIPESRVIGHGQVPGASTECPGKRFPWSRFKSDFRAAR